MRWVTVSGGLTAGLDIAEKAIGSWGGCGIALPSIAEFFSIVTHPTTGS